MGSRMRRSAKSILSTFLFVCFCLFEPALAQLPSVKTYGASGSATTTTGTISAGSNSLALANPIDFANGQGILVNHAGSTTTVGAPTPVHFAAQNATGSTTYAYAISSVDNQGGVSASVSASFNNGYATLGTYLSGTGGIALNTVTWSLGSGSPMCTAVWRSTNGGSYALLGCFTGTNIVDTGLPTQSIFWIPATPPGVARPGWLATTISSGGGTSTLTLANSAGSAVSGAIITHDDTAAISSAASANQTLVFPPGTYYTRGFNVPSTLQSIIGAGPGVSVINSLAVASTGAGVIANPSFKQFYMSGMSVYAFASMAYDGFTLNQAAAASITDSEFVGLNALRILNSTRSRALGNTLSFWNVGISNDTSIDTIISANTFNPILGQAGAIGGSATPTGNGQPWASSINTVFGTGCIVSGNTITQYGGNFGISTQSTGCLIEGNKIKYTGRECMVAFMPNTIANNYCEWAVAGNGNQSSYDFGISVSDDMTNPSSQGVVEGNTFINTALAAIAVYGSGGTNQLSNVSVVGNSIFGANQLAYPCGITLSGSNVSSILVNGNNFMSQSGNTSYNVCEVDVGRGTPNSNIIGIQNGTPANSGMVQVLGAATKRLTQPAIVTGAGAY